MIDGLRRSPGVRAGKLSDLFDDRLLGSLDLLHAPVLLRDVGLTNAFHVFERSL